ncbi:hypothetical protein F511_28819 [Dorcoceras hygrometricum]|uniref:Uncharacterized protein n=1 Tax=Dorcoceras hygrometricum TaxID=472368 RepID=A0A2Z7BD23_9LAMI|nr:hypothetical protein F511_28819 [Dorcoceras hygrometricum]
MRGGASRAHDHARSLAVLVMARLKSRAGRVMAAYWPTMASGHAQDVARRRAQLGCAMGCASRSGVRPCAARYVGGGLHRAATVRRISGSDATAIFLPEKLLYTIEKSPPKKAPADISPGELITLKQWWDDELKTRCYVMASMSNEMQRRSIGLCVRRCYPHTWPDSYY